jgi:DNA-binding MarR family transcriptional regulator
MQNDRGSEAETLFLAKEDERQALLHRLADGAHLLGVAEARSRVYSARLTRPLSITQARALRVLAERGAVTTGELTSAIGTIGAASTTQVVKVLIDAGYVTTRRDLEDKRFILVSLTEAGQACDDHLQQKKAELLHHSLAQYSTDTLQSAARVLDRLTAFYRELWGAESWADGEIIDSLKVIWSLFQRSCDLRL